VTGPNDEMRPRGIARLRTTSLRIETVEDLERLSQLLFKGGAGGQPNVDRPEKVARIILAGMEVGLSPAQSLDSIMISKTGRCSIWGDAALALIHASGLMELETFKEWVDGEGEARTGHCQAKRVSGTLQHYTFSVADANKAGLIERAKGQKGDGPWVTYQDRMLVMRARGFLLRDHYSDVLRGLITTEEAQDVIETEVKVVEVRQDKQLPPATAPATAGITEDQMRELVSIRGLMIAARGIQNEPASVAAMWKEVLDEFHVESAKQLTAEQADQLIAKLGPANDPFAYTKPSTT
jgi:hypothetical protein